VFGARSGDLEHVLLRFVGVSVPIIFVTNSERSFPQLLKDADHLAFLKINKTSMKKALVRLGASATDIANIVDTADGDIRAATNAMKFNSIMSKSGPSSSFVDSKLLLFRALGRILNSKRLESAEKQTFCSFTLDPAHRRKELEYPIPEDQCMASGFLPSSFSQFLHQNCIPFVPDIATYSSFMEDFSVGDRFSKFLGYGNDKIKEYEAAIGCRSMSFWNHSPNKAGFIAMHRPAMIENRKRITAHAAAVSAKKHRHFNGATQCSIAMLDAPAKIAISPRDPLLIDLAQLTNFRTCQTSRGQRLDQNDDIRLADSQQTNVVPQNLLKKKLDEKYESDIEINDDSDW